MSPKEQAIMQTLINGGSIATYPGGKARCRDANGNPIFKMDRVGRSIRPLLRRQKNMFVLNKSAVRKMHGASLVKKLYLANYNASKIQK